jgi:hypothetical protein
MHFKIPQLIREGQPAVDILNELNDFSPLITAIATVVLCIITGIYIYSTRWLYHSPHRAFLRPTKINTKDHGWVFVLRNFGPGLALNVQVRTVAVTKSEPIRSVNGASPLWIIQQDFVSGTGPFEIQKGQEAEYYFPQYSIGFEYPVFVCWKSITGKTQRTFWIVPPDLQLKIFSLTLRERIRYWLRWRQVNFLSPYHRIKIWCIKKRGKKA